MNFKASLHRVLEILEKSHDAVRTRRGDSRATTSRRSQVVASVGERPRSRMADGAVPGRRAGAPGVRQRPAGGRAARSAASRRWPSAAPASDERVVRLRAAAR